MVILNETVTDNAILALWEITETKEELPICWTTTNYQRTDRTVWQ